MSASKKCNECYVLTDMLGDLVKRGISSSALQVDAIMTMIQKRPVLDMFAFDDYLHEKYGEYESEDKNMNDMFRELFGEDAQRIRGYFGLGELL